MSDRADRLRAYALELARTIHYCDLLIDRGELTLAWHLARLRADLTGRIVRRSIGGYAGHRYPAMRLARSWTEEIRWRMDLTPAQIERRLRTACQYLLAGVGAEAALLVAVPATATGAGAPVIAPVASNGSVGPT